jgi:hypothetical protein
MEYVVGVIEKLPLTEQSELIYYLRDMLMEMEQNLKRKAQAQVQAAGQDQLGAQARGGSA